MVPFDSYKVLGLDPRALPKEQEVVKTYRRLALALHPDKNLNDMSAKAEFQALHDAYERTLAHVKLVTVQNSEACRAQEEYIERLQRAAREAEAKKRQREEAEEAAKKTQGFGSRTWSTREGRNQFRPQASTAFSPGVSSQNAGPFTIPGYKRYTRDENTTWSGEPRFPKNGPSRPEESYQNDPPHTGHGRYERDEHTTWSGEKRVPQKEFPKQTDAYGPNWSQKQYKYMQRPDAGWRQTGGQNQYMPMPNTTWDQNTGQTQNKPTTDTASNHSGGQNQDMQSQNSAALKNEFLRIIMHAIRFGPGFSRMDNDRDNEWSRRVLNVVFYDNRLSLYKKYAVFGETLDDFASRALPLGKDFIAFVLFKDAQWKDAQQRG